MRFSLNTTIINPINGKKPKNAVILCHGYGGDGKDISILATYWKNFMQETIFICPDAPEKCAVNPNGYQWFDLIDEVKENLNLDINKLALVGFSQGCMISLQTGLKRTDQISSIIGYSGKIISKDHLKKNIKSKPNIMLMHGDRDEVVNISSFLEAKEFFNDIKYPISSKIFKNCEHRIPTEGSSLGLQFLKKNLY